MKIVLLGNTDLNYSWFIQTHRQGLQANGVEVIDIDHKSNTIDNIKSKLLSTKPDYVFEHLVFHGFHNTHNLLSIFNDLKKHNIKFVHFCHDARSQDRYMGDISDVYHMGFVGTYEMQKNCQNSWKIPVHYSPYSSLCYNKMAKPVNDLAFSEPVFTGSPNSHDDRSSFIQRLNLKIPIKIFHTQSNNDLRNRSHELSASAQFILGLCTGYDIDGYIDVRPFQYLGSGAFMIMRKFKNMDDMIPDDLYCSFTGYSDHDVETVKNYYDYWRNKNTMGTRLRAFNFIQQNHSCKIRLKEILKKL